MIEMLRRAASDRSLSIGEAWHLLDAAADEIERLQADAHALAAERLCRAVEVAVLKSRLDAAIIAARSARAPVARKGG